MDRHQSRRGKLRRVLDRAGAEALLVTNFTNVTYLTGFTGDDSFLLMGPDRDVLLSDFRYTTQLAEECPDLETEIRDQGVQMLEVVTKTVKAAKIGDLGIEGDSMSVSLRDKLADNLPKVTLRTTSGLVEKLRQVKDKEEVEQIRIAVRLAEKGFGVLRASLLPDKTEKQVADELEFQLRQFGASSSSFTTIVAAGARAALPHARVTDRPIGESDLLLVDWGAGYGGYRSDLTRVLVTGKISPKLQRIYGVVLSAQLQAIAAVKPGVKAADVDRVARDVISDAGFGRRFGHGLGHGVGMEVHEGPRMAATSKDVLRAGMVITVEPGIYLPGWGGVRIEDDVLVTRNGHEVLSNLPKQFDEVVVR